MCKMFICRQMCTPRIVSMWDIPCSVSHIVSQWKGHRLSKWSSNRQKCRLRLAMPSFVIIVHRNITVLQKQLPLKVFLTIIHWIKATFNWLKWKFLRKEWFVESKIKGLVLQFNNRQSRLPSCNHMKVRQSLNSLEVHTDLFKVPKYCRTLNWKQRSFKF